MHDVPIGIKNRTLNRTIEFAGEDRAFLRSAYLFQVGLFLVTFEQVRPLGIEIADYFLFVSFLVLLPSIKARILRVTGSGVLLAGTLIFAGSILSLAHDSDLTDLGGSFARLLILYGLFAPLALTHSSDIRKNIIFLIAGISANCAIVTLQAWFFPGIADLLAINPVPTSDTTRFQGMTQFPVTLGITAALAMLMCFGLLLFEKRTRVRWMLVLALLICAEGALLSGSRTFLASLLPGLLILGLLMKQYRRALVRSVIGVAVLGAILALVAPGAISDFSGRIDEVGLSDYGRAVVAAQAVIEISQKPLLGWGFNHFKDAGLTLIPELYGYDPQPVHVTLLQYWYGAGLLGAIGFTLLFVLPMKRMIAVIKSPESRYTNAVRLGLALYVSTIIIFNLGPYLYNRYLYLPMFLFAGFTARALEPAAIPLAAARRPARKCRVAQMIGNDVSAGQPAS